MASSYRIDFIPSLSRNGDCEILEEVVVLLLLLFRLTRPKTSGAISGKPVRARMQLRPLQAARIVAIRRLVIGASSVLQLFKCVESAHA